MRRTLPAALASAAVLAASLVAAGPAHAGTADGRHAPHLTTSTRVVDADQSFRGLDAVDRRTAWVAGGSVSGDTGGVWRTHDGGRTWVDVSPPQTEGLNFRDVEVTGRGTVTVLAIGEGEASRIYRTRDDGRTWTETFRNTEPAAFYNCLAFFPGGRTGLAVSDPTDGRFRIARTTDGGRSWHVLPSTGMPDSTGEANFSASGECLTVSGHEAWFGSGGERSRVFRSGDLGRTWTATESRIPAGEAAGVFGLAVRPGVGGLAVGGDFSAPADGVDATSTSRDGRRWTSAGDLEHLGEDVAWLPGVRRGAVTVGESGDVGGVSVTLDAGRSWHRLSDTGFHTVDCTADGSCWAAGGKGRVARVSIR